MMAYSNSVMLMRKRRITRIFGVIGTALIFFLGGCENPASDLKIFTVSGTVRISDGDAAVGAAVYLEKQDTNSSIMTSAGSNGAYSIPDVTAGTYTIKTSLAGYDPAITPAFTISGNITDKDITLQRTIHTVTFDVNGGNALNAGQNTRTVNSGAAIGALPTATRAGRAFDGWYTATSEGTHYTEATTVTADTALYAHWTAGTVISYTVTFNVNGGNALDAGQNSRTVNSGAVIGTLPTPTRAGHTFDGWHTATSGGTQYTASSTVTADTALYAHWTGGTPTSYTVTFFVNGGSALETGQGTRTVNPGAAIGTLPMAVRAGYTFDGWHTARTGGTQYTAASTVTANIILYAHWTAGTTISYTVTFDANGGNTLDEGQNSRIVNSGAAIGTLPVPTRAGHTFDGWHTGASGGTQYTATSTITANIILYAHWTAGTTVSYTVTFDANGGNALDTGQDSRIVDSGAAIGTLPVATRAGYTFDGWHTATSGGIQYTAASTVTADTALYAHWSAGIVISYTVTFNANGGSALDAGQDSRTVNSGAVIGILPTPTRAGHTFNGWHTATTGGIQYIAASPITANNTLYAQWTINAYTIIFDANGGNALAAGQDARSVNYGLAIGALPTPTRAGYTFDGWHTEASGGTQYTAATTVTETITLYAHWTHTIAFDVNGGNALGAGQNTRTVNHGATIGTLPAATRVGYSFDGWYAATNGWEKYTATSTVTADITLHAHWTINTYTVTFIVNGGNALGAGQNTRTVNHGATIGTLPAATRVGYSFDGWYTAIIGGTQYTDTSNVMADITLYAHWTLVTGGAGITLGFKEFADITIDISPFNIYKTDHGNATAYPASQTITLADADIYTNIAWFVDNGTVALGSTDSVTVNAMEYSVSAHTLMVEVTKEGKSYSQVINFLVNQ